MEIVDKAEDHPVRDQLFTVLTRANLLTTCSLPRILALRLLVSPLVEG